MVIAAGARLGHYEIAAPIGAGGMGEVWRARDTRFNREVAIKLLPVSFANDADRLRRFELEALATSALNHPNILTIHDIGIAPPEFDGVPFLVTELLAGAELRTLLPSQADGRPLSVRNAIDYAQQIAAGLAAAHEKGIVHRDLKPENLFVTSDGRVKILDFGLAKLKQPKSEGVDVEASTQKLTRPGVVMGTVGYMSPEQVRGEQADHRSDIFSFGVILYEMLSGVRAFSGDSAVEVMNAILKEDPPDLTTINPKVSLGLERLIRRCLEKKPEQRFHSTHDLGYALEALSTSSSGAHIETSASLALKREPAGLSRLLGQTKLTWVVVAVFSLAMLGLIWSYVSRPQPSDPEMMKFSILPPEKSSFGQIAVSPDGRHLAFTALSDGKTNLWVRSSDETGARTLQGTQSANLPFWSPDSRFIGFFADGSLKKIEVAGGPVTMICEVAVPLGATWNREGVILFAQVPFGLFQVAASGGIIAPVTTPDTTRQEFSYSHPTFLPDGRHFLYSISSEVKTTRGVYIGSLDGKVKRRLLDDAPLGKYVAAVSGDTSGNSGWLIFVRDGALLVQPFDSRRFEFTGEPFVLSETVGSDLSFGKYFTFSASDTGVLVFDPSLKRHRRQYLWLDRRGQQINSLDGPAGLFQLWLSPDEKRFIADRVDPQSGTYDLWLADVSGGNATRFTFDPRHDLSPVWSPDGSRIVWASSQTGIGDLYQKPASLGGDESLLLKSEESKYPTDWSQDGRFIIYSPVDPKTKDDVWALPVTGRADEKPFPVVKTEANETAGALSPDGRWLAYTSDATGRNEVYIVGFPKGGGKRQISTSGGSSLRWRRDGRELFYYAMDGKLMAAPVKSGDSIDVGAAVSLFEFRAGSVPGFSPFAVTADGQRFLVNAIVEAEPNAPLTVVLNWNAQAKK